MYVGPVPHGCHQSSNSAAASLTRQSTLLVTGLRVEGAACLSAAASFVFTVGVEQVEVGAWSCSRQAKDGEQRRNWRAAPPDPARTEDRGRGMGTCSSMEKN